MIKLICMPFISIYDCLMQTIYFVYSQTTGEQKDSEQKNSAVDNTVLAAGAGVGGAVIVTLLVIGVIVFIRYR